MSAYLLDTSVVIDWLRGRAPVVAWLGAAVREGAHFAVTPVTVAEVLAGVDPQQRDRVAALLKAFAWQGMTFESSVRAAQLFWEHDRAGRGLPLPDLLQAAAALESTLIVATSNVRHFPDAPVLDPRLYTMSDD